MILGVGGRLNHAMAITALLRVEILYFLETTRIYTLLPIVNLGLNFICVHFLKRGITGASLVAQWLRICLPMQGTRVRALVWEDPTCRGATRPVSHNY